MNPPSNTENVCLYKKSLFIFRRDLRLDDNTGLIQALTKSQSVIPCFIFNPEQITEKNKYRSLNAIQFMIESLKDLDTQLKTKKNAKLFLFYGAPEETVEQLIKTEKIDAVFVNRDYTPFSTKRDATIKKICEKNNCAFESYDDLLLNNPDNILTGSEKPYGVFTPYFKKSSQTKVEKPEKNRFDNFYIRSIKNAEDSKKLYGEILSDPNPDIHSHGGTTHAKKIIKNLSDFKNYEKERNVPALSTTHLSAHMKFGTVSIRETYHAIIETLGRNHPLVRQLYWRDFYTYVAYHNPFVFGHAYHKKYDSLPWHNDKKDFIRWCQGTTGFPIVDAGMRQLNKTGFMHNRVRMIVGSFLTKDLHIDWQWGEHYFAQKLIDYDPCVNNGNWQWTASTGCDAQPYFRIFNPWLQQKNFDPECVYIKQWVPELKKIDQIIIHNWYKTKYAPLPNYPKPMIDHATESALTKKIFKKQS